MRIFGKNVHPRQIVLFASGVLVLAATSYDVHRSIKNNQTPPSEEQIQALEDYINSARRPQEHLQALEDYIDTDSRPPP